MTQINTPYPATAYLKGFLQSRGHETFQADFSILIALKIFSKQGLQAIQDRLAQKKKLTSVGRRFIQVFPEYETTVDSVRLFLQGKDPTLAHRIVSRSFLPEGPRFKVLEELANTQGDDHDPLYSIFGALGVQDRAKFLASLYLDDITDVVQKEIDPEFSVTRYGEKLAASSPSFDPLLKHLQAPKTLVATWTQEITHALVKKQRPELVAISLPFPGNVYGGFLIAQEIKKSFPHIKVILGGGYVNTELRSLKDSRVFDFVDAITLDDGERPIECLIEYFQGKREQKHLFRTFIRNQFVSSPTEHDVPHKETGTPTYNDLPIDQYISVLEMLNPMHRLWSDGRWNKITLAHGCYWKKCNFCDVSLDYIGRYDPASADLIVDRMESLVRETHQTGFHFVDEAAPPALLKNLAERIIARKLVVTWWGNIRFEKSFTPELTNLLAKSGCVAVSGGLEVASDRLLKLMNKGVSVEQVARVTQAFTSSGILVHAYLMYGFPTQTEQETVDALERVRQLFAEGCIHSAYWHRFSATIHSPIGKDPKAFGIRLKKRPTVTFAENDLPFSDPVPCDHDLLGEGLKKALYNYMHGVGLDQDVRVWFNKKVPKAKVPHNLIQRALLADR